MKSEDIVIIFLIIAAFFLGLYIIGLLPKLNQFIIGRHKEDLIEDEMTKAIGSKANSIINPFYYAVPMLFIVIDPFYPININAYKAMTIVTYANICLDFIVKPLVKRHLLKKPLN